MMNPFELKTQTQAQPAAPARPTIGVDQASGRLTLDGQLLERTDARMFGSAGDVSGTVLLPGMTVEDLRNHDPRYWEQVERPGDDSGPVMEWQLRPEIAERLNGRTQLSQTGVGGYSEVIDPSRLEWDDEFGIVTDPDNIGAPDDRRSRIIGALAMAVFGGAAVGPILAAELGAGAGTGAALDLSQVGAGSGFGLEGTAGGAAITGGGTAAPGAFGTAAGDWAALIGSGGAAPGGSLVGTGLSGGAGALGSGASLAGTGLAGGAGTGGLAAGLAPVSGAIGTGTGIPGLDTVRDIGTRIGEGNMDWMDMIRGAYDSTDWTDVLGRLGRAGLNEWSSGRAREDTAAQQALNRDYGRELRFTNQNTPAGTSRWVKDPQTGQWTQTLEMAEEDKPRLEDWRRMANDRTRAAANVQLPQNIDFQAIANRFIPQSLGGTYMGGSQWIDQHSGGTVRGGR